MRTIPWVREAAERYRDTGLAVVGVHTPEFDHERNRESVAVHVKDHGLSFSHLLDNDYAYWRALDNEYWPSVYLIDRCGWLRGRVVGEVHRGQPSGRQLEAAIEKLLAEETGRCRE